MSTAVQWLLAVSTWIVAAYTTWRVLRLERTLSRADSSSDRDAVTAPANPAASPQDSIDAPEAHPEGDAPTPTIRWLRESAKRMSATVAPKHARDRLIWVEIIAELDEETVGWIGEDHTYGFVEKTKLGYPEAKAGDLVRALVLSTPWNHSIEGSDPASVHRINERIRARQLREFEKKRVFKTWHDFLTPGDLVIARVPFGPHGRRTMSHITGKTRPAVFIRFNGEYIVVKGVFSAGKFEERERDSLRLVDPKNILKRKSVVGSLEQELDVGGVLKKVGRLSDIDIKRIGLATPTTEEIQLSESRAGRFATAFLEAHSFPDVPTYPEVVKAVISTIARVPEFDQQLADEGVYLSEIGSILSLLRNELAIHQSDDESLAQIVAAVLAETPGLNLAYEGARSGSERVVHASRVLLTPPPQPTAAATGAGWRPIDYEAPQLIIVDQLWTYQELEGRRLDLEVLGESLRELGNGRMVWLGPDVTVGLKRLQSVVRSLGWDVVGTADRDGDIALITEIAGKYPEGPIAVVSAAQDLLDEIEAVCERVLVIDQIDAFISS